MRYPVKHPAIKMQRAYYDYARGRISADELVKRHNEIEWSPTRFERILIWIVGVFGKGGNHEVELRKRVRGGSSGKGRRG